MTMYAIEFRQAGRVGYAGTCDGAAGIACTLETADTFETAESAERYLALAYGSGLAPLGEVVPLRLTR